MSKRQSIEFQHQCALFEWARMPGVLRKYPALDLLSSSQNGANMGEVERQKAAKSGLLPGEMDLKLPVARGRFIGLVIELKYGKNKPTKEQLRYARRMTEEGHFAAFLWSWEDAMQLIVNYLEGRVC